MPIVLYKFHCSNGHTFEANAKLRTRCPECGVSTKRSFETVKPEPVKTEPVKTEPTKTEPVKATKTEPVKRTGPVLIRQGRERMPARKTAPPKRTVAKPKTPLVGAKLAGGLVKSHTIKKVGVMPTIKKRPVKTAIARGIKTGHEVVKPYWHSVADKFGF